MKPTLRAKLDSLVARREDLERLLASEDATRDMEKFRSYSREHADVSSIAGLYDDFKKAEGDAEAARELDMPEEAKAAQASMERLQAELQKALLPKDPNDERNVFLEIRAGTGGDESALFAGDLFRMYTRYAERQRWQVEIISESSSELGGYKEVIVRIIGQGVYSKLKFESGGHRVQRVPETEAQGRIHTSACTVAILPEADQVNDVVLNPAELRIDTFRASGAGGQHVNKTSSAVRLTHVPTGLVVASQQERSQHKNRQTALKMLKNKLYQLEAAKQAQKKAEMDANKSDVSFGSQIRSYVFQPYTMVNDHRTELKIPDVQRVMDGDIDPFIEAFLKQTTTAAA